MEILIILALALAADLAFGELPTPVHPVGWMGKLASLLEKPGADKPPAFQFIYGAIMTLFLIGLFATTAYLFLFYLDKLSPVAYIIGGAALLKSTFSLKEL